MAIRYFPDDYLKKIVSRKQIENMINRRTGVDLKRAALNFVDGFDFIDKDKVAEVALKTLSDYEKRIEENKISRRKLLANPKQLIQRVQNSIIWQISNAIESQYQGEPYEWLPSNAKDPDPEHQLNYGKIFIIGDGDMPGKRYGCQCGMRILTDKERLILK